MALIYGVNYQFDPGVHSCRTHHDHLAIWLVCANDPEIDRVYCHDCFLQSLRNIHDLEPLRETWL